MQRSTLSLLLLLLTACGDNDAPAAAATPRPTVEFVRPVARDIVDWDEFTGRLEAIETVDVRARVSGLLESIHFEDGEEVEEGQLLFVIDPRPFQAELDAREADVQVAEAARNFARSNYDRGRKLLESNAIAAEDVDARAASLAETEAALVAARARVAAAQLDVDFTRVTAPIAGRASDHFVSVGNLISGGTAQSTLLTSIVSTDPIYCRIEADENLVLNYLRLNAAGKRQSSRDYEAPVQLGLADEEGFPHEGVLDFVDNRFDAGTATMRARARFDNPDSLLFPGMFARIRITGEGERRALLVPDKSVQTTQTLRYVLVVDEADVVQYRPVVTGALTADGLREIKEGVAAEDRVVSSGLFFARPGTLVQPQEAEASAAR